jgi:hypothetical protein
MMSDIESLNDLDKLSWTTSDNPLLATGIGEVPLTYLGIKLFTVEISNLIFSLSHYLFHKPVILSVLKVNHLLQLPVLYPVLQL